VESDLPTAEWLSANNADLTVKDKDGLTGLQLDADEGHLMMVKWLAEENVAIDAKDNGGMMTALHYAAHKGHLEIVIWLVESGRADVDGVDNKRKTASDVAKDKEIPIFGDRPIYL
jgi:ankyrin repeat protein